MLDWVRTRIDGQPEGLHALIVPDLAARRGVIQRALEATLQPELELPGTAGPPCLRQDVRRRERR